MYGPMHPRLEVLAKELERRMFVSGLISGFGGGAYLAALALIFLNHADWALALFGVATLCWLWRMVRIAKDVDACFDVTWYRERRRD